MDEAAEIMSKLLSGDFDGQNGRSAAAALVRKYGEQCRQAGAGAMREALEEIKSLVVGDKRPRWADDWATTTTRGSIADIVDEALGALPSAAEAASPAAGWKLVSIEPTEAQEDAGATAYDDAHEQAVANRKARNDLHEAAGRGRILVEDADFPIDWLKSVYQAMLKASPSEEARAEAPASSA